MANPGNSDQLSKGGDDGTLLGQSATDLIGFFGKTARVQVTAITSVSVNGASTANMKAAINKLRLALKNLGLSA